MTPMKDRKIGLEDASPYNDHEKNIKLSWNFECYYKPVVVWPSPVELSR